MRVSDVCLKFVCMYVVYACHLRISCSNEFTMMKARLQGRMSVISDLSKLLINYSLLSLYINVSTRKYLIDDVYARTQSIQSSSKSSCNTANDTRILTYALIYLNQNRKCCVCISCPSCQALFHRKSNGQLRLLSEVSHDPVLNLPQLGASVGKAGSHILSTQRSYSTEAPQLSPLQN